MIKKIVFFGVLGIMFIAVQGCTHIEKIEPCSGTPGQAVYLKCYGIFGDPSEQCLKWDGKEICNPFPGSFVVPRGEDGGKPGKHTVTLIDKLDASEVFLIFPLFRMRMDSVTFTVVK
jgi:hypothetical protein